MQQGNFVSIRTPETLNEPALFVGYSDQTCLVDEESLTAFVVKLRSSLSPNVKMRILGYHRENGNKKKVVRVWVLPEELESLNRALKEVGYNVPS